MRKYKKPNSKGGFYSFKRTISDTTIIIRISMVSHIGRCNRIYFGEACTRAESNAIR